MIDDMFSNFMNDKPSKETMEMRQRIVKLESQVSKHQHALTKINTVLKEIIARLETQ